MSANIPPEEKLLRLIRGHKHKVPAPAAPVADRAPESAQAGRSPVERIHRPRPSLKALARAAAGWGAGLGTRQYLIAGFAAAGLYLLATLAYPLFIPKTLTLPPATGADASVPAARQEGRPLSYYQEAVKGRPIFAGEGAVAPGVAGAINPELVKDLNVVGIIAGDNPQVIIEDKRTQRTYYASKGQTVGDFVIDDILDGKVVVNYRGQKFELYL